MPTIRTCILVKMNAIDVLGGLKCHMKVHEFQVCQNYIQHVIDPQIGWAILN